MTNTFSALSLKRNRSNNNSKINSILNKLANSFNKKKKPFETTDVSRRPSISAIFDYFRSSSDGDDAKHPFANDALFEHNRYKQQKQQQSSLNQQIVNMNSSILINTNNTKSTRIQHRHTQSAITARSVAAARKKKSNHIRHYSHVSCISSSNITVNSEDLTAKEFADIAGIRILSEEENDTIHDRPIESGSKICTFCGTDDNELPSLIVTSSHHNNSSILRSSHSISSNNSSVYNNNNNDEPQIWDNDFWQKPGTSSSIIEPPPILHELKRYNTQQQDTYIKKGRFEIHLSSSSNVSSPPLKNNKKPEMVVEWKRKSRPSSLKHQIM